MSTVPDTPVAPKVDPMRIGCLIAVPVAFVLGIMAHAFVPSWKPTPSPQPTPALSLQEQLSGSTGTLVDLRWMTISPVAGGVRGLAWTPVGSDPHNAQEVTLLIGQPEPVPPGPQPIPPAPPGPTPPKPPVPIVTGPLRVLVVIDSDPQKRKQYTAAQIAAMQSVKVLNYLNTHCAKGPDGKTPEWRIWQDNANVAKESASFQAAFAKPRQSLPWLIISNGTLNYEGPLPADDGKMLEILTFYGGQ